MANTIIAKIASRAKVIRKAKPTMSWQTAIKKASAELKGRSIPTTSKRRVLAKKVGSTQGYKVVGKKNGQLVDITEYPMDKTDAIKFIKGQGIENYYTNVDIVPYRGNKKIIKYIGIVSKTKKGTPRKRLTKAEREYNADVDLYKYFIVMVKTGNVQSGWEYKSDAQDALSDYNKGSAKIMTLPQMKKAGIKDPRNEYKHTVGAKKPISRHKDTKSHNVNIRVMSGTKLKIPKAGVDFNALNGIMQYEKGKFYEIAAPYRGTVVKITRIVKKNSKTYKNTEDLFFGDLYRYKNGYLHKPVKVQFYRIFLDKHTAIPRPSVKAHEYKKFV